MPRTPSKSPARSLGRTAATLAVALFVGLAMLGVLTPSIAEAAAPTVSSISPSSGPNTGGTAVTITGTGFVAGATVTIGGVAATGVNVASSTSITATTAAATAGPANVVVTNPDTLASTLVNGFTYLGPAPTANLVNPNNGPSSGGTAVTITGTDFVTGALVSFGGTLATGVTVVNATTITATTPAHTIGAVNVVVTNPDTQSSTLVNGFTYTAAAAPTVSAVAPSTGTTGGGTPVTIIGTGFVGGATVKFGANSATSVVVTNSTTITAVTPAGSAGTVAVTVTNPDTQNGTLPSAYTYAAAAQPTITAVSPNTGPITGGTSITITGTNFLPGAAVEVGGTAATSVVVVSSTSITAKTPSRSTTGAVSVKVTNTDNKSATLAAPAFTYVGPPKITAIDPSTGSVGGGTTVKITGSGFLTGATVTFDGIAATSVSVVSATEISAKT
ncbi:MAG: IPT/TIG domain-containing protein, partial [Dehalococcoidia bacterium]